MFGRFHLITRIFLLVTIVTSCSILLNTIGILYVVEKNQRESAVGFEHTNLKRSAYSIDLIMDEARELAGQIQAIVPIRKLLYYSELTRNEIDEGIHDLRNFQTHTGQVHSLYVLNIRNDKVFYISDNLHVSSEWQRDNFFDSEFLRSVISSQGVNRFQPIHRMLLEYDWLNDKFEQKEVYSFVYSFTHSTNYETSSLIVINISVDWMRKTLRELDQSPAYPVFVFNRNGEIISGGMDDSGFSIKYLANLPFQGNEFNTFQVKKDGEEYLIVAHQSAVLENWVFLEIIPLRAILFKTRQLRRVYALISLSLLAVSAVLVYLSTLRFKRPLEDLIHTVERQTQLDKKDRLIIQYSKIQTLFQFGSEYSPEERKQILLQCNRNFKVEQPFSIAYLAVRDKVPRSYSEKVSSIIESCPKKRCTCIFPIKSGGLVLLSQLPERHHREMLNYTVSRIKEDLAVRYYLVYFTDQFKLPEINDKLSIFLELHPYLTFFAHNNLEDISIILKQCLSHPQYPVGLEKEVHTALIQKNRECFEKLWKKYLDYISSNSLLYFHRSLSRFFLSLYESLRDINPMIPRMLKVKDLETLLDTIEGLDSYESFVIYCNTIFTDLIRVLAEYDTGTGKKVIDKVLAFIDEQYTNPLLGSQYIADHVSLSSNYLLKLFKQETRVSLHTYINNFRLKKAADLLESSDEQIRDIMRLTGFSNEQSFFRLFKKRYNQTPACFRSIVNGKKSLEE